MSGILRMMSGPWKQESTMRGHADPLTSAQTYREVPIARLPVVHARKTSFVSRMARSFIKRPRRGSYCGSDPKCTVVLNEPEKDGLVESDIEDQGSLIFVQLKHHMERFITASQDLDLGRLRTSKAFLEFDAYSRQLYLLDFGILSHESIRTLFLNLFNCLALHVQLLSKRDSSFRKSYRRFSLRSSLGRDPCGKLDPNLCAYNVGGYIFTLDDILHGILRGNRAPSSPLSHPRSSCRPWRPFHPGDPRYSLSVSLDPRIHFLLNGRGARGSLSTTKIRFLRTSELENTMDTLTSGFLVDDMNLSVSVYRQLLIVSNLFAVYEADFGEDVVDFIATMLSPFYEKRKDLNIIRDGAIRLRYLKTLR